MTRAAARTGALLPGKGVLIVITVTAVTSGFALGYFVGRSMSPSSLELPVLKQSASSDLTSVPVEPNSPSELKNEASSSLQPQMQPSIPESTQASAPPSPHGATPLTADVRDEERVNLKSQKAAMTEKKVILGSGAQPVPPARVSNEDKGAKNTSDPQDTEKSAPTQSADSSGKRMLYTVQAAAFNHQKDAYALRQTLEGEGYKVFIKKEMNPKGTVLFKVRVGEFEQKKDASVFALKLKKTDGLNAFAVVKN